MLRRIFTIGVIVVALTAPAAAVGHAQRSRTYKGTIDHAGGGGTVSLTITGSSVTAIHVTGNWTCDNGVVPISYKYTLRSRRAHPAHVSVKRAFRGNHLKFASPDLYDNMGKYSGSGSLSGTVKGATVTGRVSVGGSTPDSSCSGGGRYTATLTN